MGKKILIFTVVFFLLFVITPNELQANSIFGTGVDGDLVVNTGQTLNIDEWYNNKYGANQYNPNSGAVPNFRNVTVNSGGTITVSQSYSQNNTWGGQVVFKATGTVTVNGTINVDGKGYDSDLGPASGESVFNSSWFFDGQYYYYHETTQSTPGGGGGGNVTSGQNGQNGSNGSFSWAGGVGGVGAGKANPHIFGSGGGNSTHRGNNITAFGGRGGGHVNIFAQTININGAIVANGTEGQNFKSYFTKNSTKYTGGAGGGAGGTIFLTGKTVAINNNLRVLGGAGGDGRTHSNNICGRGGAGGKGLVKIDYETLTGTITDTDVTLFTQVDLTPPTGSLTINDGALNSGGHTVTLNFTASDLGSGLKRVKVSNYADFRNSQYFNYTSNGNKNISWTLTPGEGVKTVYAVLEDNAGNLSNTLEASINVVADMTPPTVKASINAGKHLATNLNLDVLVEAYDDFSSIEQMSMRFSTNGTSWTAWESYKFTKTINLASPPSGIPVDTTEGIKRIFVQVRDGSGNIGNGYASIKYVRPENLQQEQLLSRQVNDTEPPKINYAGLHNGARVITGSTAIIDISIEDNATPVKDLRVYISNRGSGFTGISPTAPDANGYYRYTLPSSIGLHTIHIKVEDLAGNYTTTSFQVFKL